MMTLRQQLVKVCDAYALAKGVGRQRVSTLILNRGSTVGRLATGEVDITTGTFEAAMVRMSQDWPEGAEWPADVPRPVAPSIPEAAE